MHSYPIARRCVIRPVRVCVVAVGCVWRVRYSPLTDTSMAPRSAHWAPRTDSSRSFPQYIIQPFKYQSCKRPTEEPPAHRRRRSSWRRMEVEKRANGYEYPDRNNAKSVNGRWRSLHLQWGNTNTTLLNFFIQTTWQTFNSSRFTAAWIHLYLRSLLLCFIRRHVFIYWNWHGPVAIYTQTTGLLLRSCISSHRFTFGVKNTTKQMTLVTLINA